MLGELLQALRSLWAARLRPPLPVRTTRFVPCLALELVPVAVAPGSPARRARLTQRQVQHSRGCGSRHRAPVPSQLRAWLLRLRGLQSARIHRRRPHGKSPPGRFLPPRRPPRPASEAEARLIWNRVCSESKAIQRPEKLVEKLLRGAGRFRLFRAKSDAWNTCWRVWFRRHRRDRRHESDSRRIEFCGSSGVLESRKPASDAAISAAASFSAGLCSSAAATACGSVNFGCCAIRGRASKPARKKRNSYSAKNCLWHR